MVGVVGVVVVPALGRSSKCSDLTPSLAIAASKLACAVSMSGAFTISGPVSMSASTWLL